MQNAADLYLQAVINRELSDPDHHPTIDLRNWRYRKYVKYVTLSGSRAKSTALKDSDTDLLITLSPIELPVIQQSLADHFHGQVRNVAVRIIQNNQLIDLVPTTANTLWQNRYNTTLKTNVQQQLAYVRDSGRQNEIRALKLWRARNALRFPSFLMELFVIRSLSRYASLSESFLELIQVLATTFELTPQPDPANEHNIVSDTLTPLEKHRIAQAAAISLKSPTWPEIL